jgi:hypothetical protein
MANRPEDLLIFYGYLNSFNSDVNGWNNELVAQDMAKYNVFVFGDGVQDPNHPDYANAVNIIDRLKELKSDSKIFGYVSAPQIIEDFQTKVNQWDNLKIDGIFIDEAGYDYGVTRDQLNAEIFHIRNTNFARLCFVNAWNMEHILGITNDVNYPNSSFNPNLNESLLDCEDIYLLESFVVNTASYSSNDGYATQSDVMARGNKAIYLKNKYGIQLASVNIIDNNSVNGENFFKFCYNAAVLYDIDINGSSDINYGAGTAKVNFWKRPNKKKIGKVDTVSVIQDLSDNDIIFRYGKHAKVYLDFSDGEHESAIKVW